MEEPDKIFENCFLIENKITDLPSSAGLVLFADNQDSPIALLTAANIRRTVKNKLAEQAEKSKRADLKSITSKIYYTACPCKFRLAIKHYETVKKVFAQNYKNYITLVSPWFLTVDLTAKFPFFSVTRKPIFKNNEKILGPFPTQKSAVVLLNTLEDVFRLCRKSEFINNPASAPGCPYLQMDACLGVCAGKIKSEEYRKITEEAFEACVNPQATIEKFQTEMQTAAKELNFEKSAQLKKGIEKLAILKKDTYRWTGDLKKLKIVHIDKSVKIKPKDSKLKKQTYAIFVMNFFKVIDLGDFFKDNPDIINKAINKNLVNLSDTPDSQILELFSILSYFLYRSKPSGLWLNTQDKINFEKI